MPLEQDLSTKLEYQVHRNAQETDGENIFDGVDGLFPAPSLAPADRAFNYRSCGTGGQQGFASLEFVYDVETNLTSIPPEDVIQTLSRVMMDRLLNTSCGITFYRPPLRIESLSSGLQDEFLRPCNIVRSFSRSCSRYIGSLLVGLNNTDVLVSLDRRVGDIILPKVASDMSRGVYVDLVNQDLESLRVTRVAYVGVPIYGEQDTISEKAIENGELTPLGYGLLGLCLAILVCVCFWGWYIYRNVIVVNEKDEVNSTFLMEENEEEGVDEEVDRITRNAASPPYPVASVPQRYPIARRSPAERQIQERVAEPYQGPSMREAPLRRVDSSSDNSVSHRMMKPKVYSSEPSETQKTHVRPSPFHDRGKSWTATPLSTLSEETRDYRGGSKGVRHEIAL